MDERREEREELAAIDREQLAAQAEERAYWQDEGLEHAERVTLDTARWVTVNWIGSAIQCLACHGAGWITALDYRGLPYPMRCPACHGTGSQPVKP